MYFAHAGHQHLTEQAAKTHNDQVTITVMWAIGGAVLFGIVLYVYFSKRTLKKPRAKQKS